MNSNLKISFHIDRDRRRGAKCYVLRKGEGPEGDCDRGRLGMMRLERDGEKGKEGGWM